MLSNDLDTRIAVATVGLNYGFGYLQICKMFNCSTADLSRLRNGQGKFKETRRSSFTIKQLHNIAQVKGGIEIVATQLGIDSRVVALARKKYYLDDEL